MEAGDVEFVRRRRDWAARRDGVTIADGRTRREVQEKLDTQARLRAEQEKDRQREAAWLAERGLSRIDYRDLRPGDSFIAAPVRFCPTVRLVTGVEHYENGASLAFYHRTAVEVACGDQGCTLFVPESQCPAHGTLRHGKAGAP